METLTVRAAYKAKADQIKAEFMRINPNYKYTPRKSSEVKRRSKRTTSTSETPADSIDESEQGPQDENDVQAFSDTSESSPAPTEE